MKRYIYLLFAIFFFTFSIDVKADYTVYVTKTGECYHIEGCSYLKSSIPISLEDAISRGYRPCSRCKPDSNLGETYTPKSSTTNSTTRSVTNQEPNITPTPKPTTAPKSETKQETENDNNFWENALYFAVGGGVVYGISKKSKRE
jgi:hypothetical protein